MIFLTSNAYNDFVMDIGQIYKRAFEIVKNNRWLWVFGMALVAFAGGGGANFVNFFNWGDFSKKDISSYTDKVNYDPVISYVKDVILSIPPSLYFSLAIVLVLATVTGFIISLVVSSWARGAAIGAINDTYDGKTVSLRSGSEHGLRGFKNILWLTIVPWFLYFLTVVVVGGLLTLLIMIFIKTPLMYIMVFFLVILLFMAAIAGLAVSMVQIWAERIVIIEGKDGREAFKEGWLLVKQHFLNMLLLGTANCFLSCCFGLVFLGIIAASIGSGLALIFINKQLGVFFLMVIGFSVLLVVLLSILVSGIYKIFNYTTWNILYRQIKEGKISE